MNFLKGANGDAVNALLCACVHNLRKVLNRLRLFALGWESGCLTYSQCCVCRTLVLDGKLEKRRFLRDDYLLG